MELRRVGLTLLASAALLWLAVMAVASFPTNAYALEERVVASGDLEAKGLQVAVAEARLHAYDAENDTTFLYVRTCSHSFCGVVVGLRGDLRTKDLSRPMMLTPVDERLSLVAAPPPDASLAEDHFVQEATQAYSSAFEIRSAWPPFLARLAAVALLGAGLGLVVRPARLAAVPGALGAVWGLAVAGAPMSILLSQFAIVPLVIAALIVGLVAIARKRPGWSAGAILLFGVVELGASFLAMAHFPPGLDA